MRTIQVLFALVLFVFSEPVANCSSRLRQSVRPKGNEKIDEYMSKWTNAKKRDKNFLFKIYYVLVSISCLLILIPHQIQTKVSLGFFYSCVWLDRELSMYGTEIISNINIYNYL